MQLRDNFAIALLLQSTVSLATALLSAHLENNRYISQSNTVLKLSRKRPLLKFLKRPRPLLGLQFDLFSCFLFPISDHLAAWSRMIVKISFSLHVTKVQFFTSADKVQWKIIACELQKKMAVLRSVLKGINLCNYVNQFNLSSFAWVFP